MHPHRRLQSCDPPSLDARSTRHAQMLMRLLVQPLLHLSFFNATVSDRPDAALAVGGGVSTGAALHSCAGDLQMLESGWPVCDEDLKSLRSSDCLAYSVGIGGDFSFDDQVAERGCNVHSFDPTTRLMGAHVEHNHTNVTFHPWGLHGGDCHAANENQSFYGVMSGEMQALPQLVRRLGHERQALRVLKVDCEGCEWDALSSHASFLSDVDLLMLELHFGGDRFKMATDADVARAGSLFASLFHRNGFCLYYYHMNPAGAGDFKDYHPVLQEAGAARGAPSYEVGLRKCGKAPGTLRSVSVGKLH